MQDPYGRFSHDPRDRSVVGLRASDADREVVWGVLGEAFAEGRLTREEYDERSQRVTDLRFLGEVPPFVEDLVPPPIPGMASRRNPNDPSVQERALAAYQRERRDKIWQAISVSMLCVVIWLVTTGATSFPWPAFVIAATSLAALRVVVRRQDEIADHAAHIAKKDARERAKLERGSSAVDRFKGLRDTFGNDN